jgi:TolB protein
MRRHALLLSALLLVSPLVALGCNSDNLIVPTTGTLEITTVTTGAESDPDGYTVQVDAGTAQAISAAGSLQNSNLSAGNHTVKLAGVAANCGVAGENPRTVGITAGEPNTVAFQVSCTAPIAPAKIAFMSYREGSYDIYTMNVDGTSQTNLTRDLAVYYGADPSWSPNGRMIAFRSSLSAPDSFHDVFVMNADGSGPMNLSPDDDDVRSFAWSPDGRQLAIESARVGGTQLSIISVDGSGSRVLTEGSQPTWSPDGTRIAFIWGGGISVIDADGSNRGSLTHPGEREGDLYPRWSPNGNVIAYSRGSYSPGDEPWSNLWLVNADGSNPRALTTFEAGDINGFAWSPDGTKLAFAHLGIHVVRSDGTDEKEPIGNLAGCCPSWSPDGKRIVFTASTNLIEPEIYIMDADGENLANITNNTSWDAQAVWQPQ